MRSDGIGRELGKLGGAHQTYKYTTFVVVSENKDTIYQTKDRQIEKKIKHINTIYIRK
jgi:hypothetical protein